MILTIGNSTPHAVATGAGTYPINAPVTLSGNVSDYDGDKLTYEWREGANVLCSGTVQTAPGGAPVTLQQDCILIHPGLGEHPIFLQVADGINDPVASNLIKVEVIDNQAPALASVANQTILWPPNHKMAPITIQANASDNSGLPVTLTASITSNEPEDGLGDGDNAPDWTEPVVDQEKGTITLQIRAERSGKGKGREYFVAITATDCFGNSSSASVKFIVPHDQGKK